MIATASIGHIILSVDASPAIRVVDPGVPLADHWTAQQVAQFPDRLVAFCSFNPLADYALDELDRCKASGRFTGVKLHFGTSEVDLRNPDHVKKVRAVVQAANRSRMPIVVHVRADANYGRIEAEISETSIPKKPIYARLGVPELWRANFDGIMVLRLKDKDYDAGEASGYFPRLDLKEFFGFVKIAMEDQFRAVKEFDAWLRGAGAKK